VPRPWLRGVRFTLMLKWGWGMVFQDRDGWEYVFWW
jgi:hypothetical protein